ncbi:putative poly-beta-1,6-N-acetyl-D-glucosamine export protein [Clostridiales bacterium]|nr:putative poly-beta-1,6-N-acetyl-D-glucosamine export protein [Clostridiales bacterium]
MEKRKEIDFINVILCIDVMLAHILSRSVETLDRTRLAYAAVFIPSRLMSMAVQSFIFLSAFKYFMRYSSGGLNYGKFIVSRTKTVILPYIFWNIIYYLCLIPLGFFIFNPVELAKYILTGSMISPFYFVIIIFQFYLLMPFWIWLVNKVDKKILLPAALIVMVLFGRYMSYWWNDRIFLKYIFYWLMGCCAGADAEAFLNTVKKYKWLISAAFIALAVCNGILTWLNSCGIKVGANLEILHISYCFVTILFLFTIALWKSELVVENSLFRLINRQSYNIFLSHCLMLYFADNILLDMSIVANSLVLPFRCCFCIGGMLGLWGVYDRISRQKT